MQHVLEGWADHSKASMVDRGGSGCWNNKVPLRSRTEKCARGRNECAVAAGCSMLYPVGTIHSEIGR